MKTFARVFSILVLLSFWICSIAVADANWTKINLSETYKNAPIYDFWGTSGSNLFAVGMNFAEGDWENRYGLILHYDGTNWTEIGSVNTRWLFSVWGSSASNIFAGGEEVDGTHGGVILHYDGTSWSEMTHPPFAANTVEDIWGSSASDVYAVGFGRILHYDGTTWSTSYQSDDPFFLFTCVWGNSPSNVFAGGFYSEGEDENYVILHYDGSDWSEMTSGTGGRLMNLWGSSGSDVFAVGYPGILHYDGTVWTKMNGGSNAPQEYVYAIWGTSSSNVFAGGTNGAIHRYDGSSWTDMQSGNTKALWNIWGLSANDVYAGGNDGTILHYTSGVPAAPVLTITTSGINVSINWTTVTGVAETILSYAPYPYTGVDSIVTVDMGTQTGLSIDLWEGAAFYVTVQAYNSFGNSAYSNIELFMLGP